MTSEASPLIRRMVFALVAIADSDRNSGRRISAGGCELGRLAGMDRCLPCPRLACGESACGRKWAAAPCSFFFSSSPSALSWLSRFGGAGPAKAIHWSCKRFSPFAIFVSAWQHSVAGRFTFGWPPSSACS